MPAAEMSVVVIDADDLSRTLRALRDQGPTDGLEIVVVTLDGARTEQRYPELADFATVNVCELESWTTTSAAIVRGVRAARGTIVTYCEDHVFPEHGWAAARLEAHGRGAAAVGGGMRNANPETATSWAAFLQSFGPFAMPVAGGRSTGLPWHQCSYRRECLPLGPELEPLLENEGLLHDDLREAGHTLVLEAASLAGHLNPSRLRSALMQAWLGGRVWGAGRAEHGGWSRLHRVLHAVTSPRGALREFRSHRADLKRVLPGRQGPVLLLLAVGTLAHAAGEALGVLFGDAGASVQRADIELNRRAHLRTTDRELP